jgi:hypothetical protein
MKTTINFWGAKLSVEGSFHKGTLDGQDPSTFKIHSVSVLKGSDNLVKKARQELNLTCKENIKFSDRVRTIEEIHTMMQSMYKANGIDIPKRVIIFDEIEKEVIKQINS